jgi:hypothetical protein
MDQKCLAGPQPINPLSAGSGHSEAREIHLTLLGLAGLARGRCCSQVLKFVCFWCASCSKSEFGQKARFSLRHLGKLPVCRSILTHSDNLYQPLSTLIKETTLCLYPDRDHRGSDSSLCVLVEIRLSNPHAHLRRRVYFPTANAIPLSQIMI